MFDFNARWMADITCDYTYCDGRCEDYCRCSRVVNAEVRGIDYEAFLQKFLKQFTDKRCKLSKVYMNTVREYCIDRLFRAYRLYDPSSWNVNICNGYYGEEIFGAYPQQESSINSDLMVLLEMVDTDCVDFVLVKEYGYLLEKLEGKEVSLVSARKEDLIVQNEIYKKGVIKGTYTDHYLPIGIYYQQGDKYALVDGYHRYVDLVKDGVYEIIVYR